MANARQVFTSLSLFAVLVGACGGAVERPTPDGTKTPPAPTSAPPPGPSPTPVAPPSAPPAPVCCPIDDHPGCCMQYGGTSAGGGSCGATCDGMASPDDPGWTKGVDANGCPIWLEPANPAHRCGEPHVIDAGPDTNPSCCPIEPSPGCCMLFGGAQLPGTTCGATCDGIAVPSDPGWKLSTDAYGCPIWIAPKNPAQLCGEVDAAVP